MHDTSDFDGLSSYRSFNLLGDLNNGTVSRENTRHANRIDAEPHMLQQRTIDYQETIVTVTSPGGCTRRHKRNHIVDYRHVIQALRRKRDQRFPRDADRHQA